MHSLSCCKRDSMIVGLAGKARSGKDTLPETMMPVTMASMIRLRMSSSTAAPRMMWDSRRCS